MLKNSDVRVEEWQYTVSGLVQIKRKKGIHVGYYFNPYWEVDLPLGIHVKN
jgi:hypothetical protein